MFLAEVVPPVGPVFVPALAALFTLCALIVAIGIVKLVDAISRAFFGTISGAVGWIPGAGGLLKQSLHKIEQKISHLLGSAERRLDGYVALTWHNMARLVSLIGKEIEGAAVSAWHLAQQAKAFGTRRWTLHEIRQSTAPLRARQSVMRRDLHNVSSETKALHHSVAQGVYPRLRVGENERAHVLNPGVASARAQAKAAEAQALAVFRWLTRHRRGVAASVFTGAVAWALTRLGGGWIRCANWRKLGKAVCRMPMSRIDALLGLLLGVFVLMNIRQVAEFAEAITEETAREVARLVGAGDFPKGRFTIE